jgi:signal peptidase I
MRNKKKNRECVAGERDSPESPVENEKKKNRKRELKKQKKVLLSILVKVGILGAAIWILFTYVVGVAQMQGQIMYPNIKDGDLMLYYRLETDYYTDDVVTFTSGRYRYTARIVAMEGDIVDINENGQVLVNGAIQSADYETTASLAGVSFPYTVEENSYFLLCDYRDSTVDSRIYGGVSKDELDGKIITVLRRRGI